MTNKLAGYRKMLGYTQSSLAKEMNISKQAYYMKEKGVTPFSDAEKIWFRDKLRVIFPSITIDEIFFN